MAAVLEFEKPILEIQEKIEELKKMSQESGMDLSIDISMLEKDNKKPTPRRRPKQKGGFRKK